VSNEPRLGTHGVHRFRRSGVTDDDEELFADLIWEAQRGDPRAFEELVAWFSRSLLGFVTARGADDPDGTANEVLVRVFRGIGGFRGTQASFRAWVFRIARNVLVDEHRRRSARATMVLHEPATLDDTLDDAIAVPDGLDRIGERERVEALLAVLTDEQREVLLLRVVAGLSVEETAETMERAQGAVRSLQHRALTRLRDALAKPA
jgi:RNA polymerase sigma-70 factor, ECF subfamily